MEVLAAQNDLLVFKRRLAKTGEEAFIRPNIFASHRTVLLRRANSTCARIFPAQVKTFVEVAAILRISVFSE